jgi:Retrotransposon gag protein
MAKIPQPPLFAGARDVDIVDGWLFQVDNYFGLAEVEEKKKVRIAAAFLKGDALEWYPAERDSITTYDEFERQFRDYFLPSHYISLMSAKFRKLLQNQFASVAEYATTLKSMGNRLKKAGRVTEHGIRESFIDGLNSNIRIQLIVR